MEEERKREVFKKEIETKHSTGEGEEEEERGKKHKPRQG